MLSRIDPNTVQPRLASCSAAARPMPDETPVTRTTFESDMMLLVGGLDMALALIGVTLYGVP
jgi:hypothetical protein